MTMINPESAPGRRELERSLAKLIAEHQAIIDAWYAKWLAEHKARVDDFWARKRS